MIEAPDKKLKILKLFKYCEESFIKAGMKVSFPKDTDPEKTYKWRYLENFSSKVDEWGISDETTAKLIEVMVQNAKKNGNIRKGLALLMSEPLIESSLDVVESMIDHDQIVVDRISQNHKLVSGTDLLSKASINGLPLIVKLYMSGKVSDMYLAISKNCSEAMLKLNRIERMMLPQGKKLIMIRMDLLSRAKIRNKLMAILKDDWRQ